MAEPGKRRSTLAPTPFARQLGEYLWHLVEAEGGDRSGRWLTARTDRSKGYWAKILNLQQALTTNDIDIVSELFGVSPYRLVRDAREWSGAEPGRAPRGDAEVVPLPAPDVRGTADTEDPQQPLARVAYRDEGATGELTDE